METRHWAGSVRCVAYLDVSGCPDPDDSHRSVGNGSWQHLWNHLLQPPSRQTSQPAFCWATKPRHKFRFSNWILCRFYPFFFLLLCIFHLACITKELKYVEYGGQSKERIVYFHCPAWCFCSMKSSQLKYWGTGLAIINASSVVMQVLWWKSGKHFCALKAKDFSSWYPDAWKAASPLQWS